MSEAAPLMAGISGIRGIVGASLTPDVVARFAGVWASWLLEQVGGRRPRVIVGFDARRGGEALMGIAAECLRAAGCHVQRAGVVTTPTLAVLVDRCGAAAGLMITASHNPQEWNGLKPIAGRAVLGVRGRGPAASAPPRLLAEDILARFRAGMARWASPAQFGMVEACPRDGTAHVQAVADALRARHDLARIQRRRFRVVLDAVCAAGAIWGVRFLRRVGCRVHLLDASRPLGVFPHPPEPLREHLGALARAVRRHRADAGLAMDPDGDRLALVNERGEYVGEEYTLALATWSVLAARGGPATVVANLSTSRLVEDVAARYGARVVRTPVGEVHVADRMRREQAVVGGEGNGGVIWPAVTFVRDALSAMGLVLALMARTGRSLADLAADLPSYAVVKRKVPLEGIGCRCEPGSDDPGGMLLDRIAVQWAGERVDRSDGVRVDLATGPLAGRAWFHVRASNTEPVLRFIAEAPTSAQAQALLDQVQSLTHTAAPAPR